MSEKRQVMKLTDKRFWIFEAFVAFVSVGVGYIVCCIWNGIHIIRLYSYYVVC